MDGGAATAMPQVSFLAYGTNKYGVVVGSGDLDGDGIDEIITGAGPGEIFGAHVRGWNYDGTSVGPLGGVNFFAYQGSRFGVFVAALDLDDDGYDELLTVPGPDSSWGTRVRAWNVDGGSASSIGSINFDAYEDMELISGGKIAGGNL